MSWWCSKDLMMLTFTKNLLKAMLISHIAMAVTPILNPELSSSFDPKNLINT